MCTTENESASKRKVTRVCQRREMLNELYQEIASIPVDDENRNEKLKLIALKVSMIRLALSGDRLIITAIVSLLGGGFMGYVIRIIIEYFFNR